MNLKLTPNSETLAENKVLILYILKNVNEALTNNNLYKIVLAVIDMNYFYFQQFLLDLLKNDYVMQYENENTTLYQITDKGIQTLELTQDILPGIIKLQVDTKLKSAMEKVNDESSIIAEYTPKSENDYNVTCKIIEKNETIFEIKTFAGSREQAKQIVDNWKSYAIQIYPKLLDTLTANYLELNPEINTSNPIADDQVEKDENTDDDNSPIDGNINLLDNM